MHDSSAKHESRIPLPGDTRGGIAPTNCTDTYFRILVPWEKERGEIERGMSSKISTSKKKLRRTRKIFVIA